MFRKFTVVYLFFTVVIMPLFSYYSNKPASKDMDRVSLFFVDRQMMRLVESEFYISDSSPDEEAKTVVKELIEGRDENKMIRRMLPKKKDAVTVYVENNIAYVDINQKYIDFYEEGKAQEQLIIYQFVNSLSSIDGISRVKFLFDGKAVKDIFGEIDMREAFVPDYCI